MEEKVHRPSQPSGVKRIVILGAGYGGLRVAMRLDHALHAGPAAEILLVDQSDHHQLITELHEVAAASIPAEAVAIPMGRLPIGKAVRFVQATVTGLDFERQRVATDAGELDYDILVISLGSETDYFGIEGLKDHSLTLKSLPDALLIKEHVDGMFALAKTEADAEVRKRFLTFVVGGGGFTGTELAGEMADRVRDLNRESGMAQGEARVVVVEAGRTLLSGFDPSLVKTAHQILELKAVELHLGDRAVRVKGDMIELKNGEMVRNHTLIWTGGVKANELVAGSGLQTGIRGRVVVNPYLETVDYANVFAVGDVALVLDPVTGRPLAPSAQLALQEANVAAQNIRARLEGREPIPFRPKVTGEVVSVGRSDALAKVGPFAFDGRLAHWLKRMTVLRYLYMLGGLQLARDWLRLIAAPTRAGAATE
ncbi:MAG: NAD(P)/FAD-dependent oxidoreductase [Chloroflexi bacterium]|nr:NAD(P)/FAD-dependent oxidoreductase [Chloroflexota bacterium]